jgi:hypothetical protein
MACAAGGVLVPPPHRPINLDKEEEMSKKKLVLYGETEVNRLIHVVKGESRTTSLIVAEKFGRGY